MWDGVLHLDEDRFQHLRCGSVSGRDQSNDPVAIGLGGVVGLKTIPKNPTAGWPVPDLLDPA